MSVLSALRAFRKPKQLSLEDYLEKLRSKGLNEDGSPVLDPTPIAPPIGYKKHPSMVDIVRDMVRSEKLAQAAREAGAETFEEAEDFEIPDEPETARSRHEAPETSLQDLLKAGAHESAAKKSKLPVDSPAEPQKPPPVPPADGPGLTKPPEK